MSAEMAETDGRLAENIIYFARALRAAGIPVGPGAVLDALAAVNTAGVGTRDDFYWTLHAVFVKRHEHSRIVRSSLSHFLPPARLSRSAYGDDAAASTASTPRPPEAGATRIQEALFSGLDEKLKKQQEIELDTRMTVSDREVLQRKDFAQMTNAEIVAAKDALRRLVLPLAEVRTRRLAPHPHGHLIDIRRTLRSSFKGGGDFIDLRFVGPKIETPARGGAPRHIGVDESVQPDFFAFPACADRYPKAGEHILVRHALDQRHARIARTRSRRCPRIVFSQRARLVRRNADRVVVSCLQ